MADKKLIVPNLRFPGFEGKWETKKLGEVCEIIGGGTPDTSIEEYWNGKIHWFTPTEIKSNFVSKSQRTISELGLKKSSAKLLPKGAILLTTRATIGEVSITLEECATNQGFQSLVPKDICNNIFIFNWLKRNKHELEKRANGSTFTEISKSEIENIQINLPPLEEQTKIAKFLSLIDERIETQRKIIAHLETLIKGIINNIFKQKIRFKDDNGNDFPGWEVKILGSIAEKRISKNKQMQIKNVLSNSASFGIIKQRDFFDKEIANQNNIKGYYVVEKDDFVYNPRISKEAPVGPISRNKIGTGVISPLYIVFRFKDEGNIDFIEHFFNSNYWYEHIESIANYGVRADRMSFSNSDFFEMPMPFPSLEEQTKIAKFLIKVDEKIQTERGILERFERQKKYLLQQMFV